MSRIIASYLLLSISLSGLSQNSEKRIALVIGNSSYKYGESLRTPANDATLMAKTLQELDFKVVKEINATRVEIITSIASFYNNLKDYKVALFYYSGHGMQVNGVNFIIPSDAEIREENMVTFEAISVNDIVKKLESYPQNTNIIILDACRSNPFRTWVRGNQLGFNAMNPGSGTIIAFATSEGQTTSDGIGENGLFTEKLVKEMVKPISIETVFKNTRVEVQRTSNNIQIPQEWTQLTGEFYFSKVSDPNTNNKDLSNNNTDNSKSAQEFGKIKLNTEIGGDIYLDDNQIGNVAANSNENILEKIPLGKHILEIRGEKSWKNEVTIENDLTLEITIKVPKDILIDERDGKTYKTIKIGDQIWMAENLNFTLEAENSKSSGDWLSSQTKLFRTNDLSQCYDGKLSNCAILGRLYKYEIAQNICPTGWHLPNEKEWGTLISVSGGQKGAGKKLVPEVGWSEGESGLMSSKTTYSIPKYDGGFGALPGGSSWGEGNYHGLGYSASWWIQTPEDSKLKVVYLGHVTKDYSISIINANSNGAIGQKSLFRSVRCIKD